MDLSAPCRTALPDCARVAADAFQVKLANRKIGDVFRRLSYRTGHPHQDPGLPRPLRYLLRCNIENMSPEHLATIINVLDGGGQQIAAVWIAQKQLRDLLALPATTTHPTPAPSAVRGKLATFYLWYAGHADIPKIKTLANTIEKRQQPVIGAVLTGYSNAKAQAHNRTAKLVAKTARGFASPENQDRRARMATTRKTRLARSKQPRHPWLCRRSQSAARPPQTPVAVSDDQARPGTAGLPAAPRLSTETQKDPHHGHLAGGLPVFKAAVRSPGEKPWTRKTEIVEFRTFDGVLQHMAAGLARRGVTHVVMEASGVYTESV